MANTVSVEQALRRGKLVAAPMVIVPVPLLLLILNVATRFNPPGYAIGITLVVSLVSIIGLALVYWKAAMTRWQVWAFMHVVDVQELKKAAMTANLLNNFVGLNDVADRYPDAYKVIAQRLDMHQKLADDSDVPNETSVYYRKIYQQPLFFYLLVFFALGVFALSRGFYAYGLIATLMPVGLLLWQYSKTSSPSPQLILNEDGLEGDGTFTSWKDITNDDVINTGSKSVR